MHCFHGESWNRRNICEATFMNTDGQITGNDIHTPVVTTCPSLPQGRMNCRAVFKSCFSSDMWPFWKRHKRLI